MKNGIDNRRHHRVPLVFKAFIKTPKGTIEGNTAAISVSDLAVLLFKEKPEIGDIFQIAIKLSEEHESSVTCEKVWTDTMVADKYVSNAIGAHFTKISENDRKFIASTVAEYYI